MSKIGISWIPLRLDSSMMFSVFLVIGYLLKTTKLLEKKYSLLQTVAIIFISTTLCFMCGFKSNNYVNICDCVYGNCGDYLIAAVSGTIAVVFISKLLETIPVISSILSDIGKYTLFIFALQAYSYNQLNFIINKLFNTNFIIGDIPEYFYSAILALLSTLALYLIKKLLVFCLTGIFSKKQKDKIKLY